MQPARDDIVEMDGKLLQFVPIRGGKGYTLEPYSLENQRTAKRTDRDRAKSKAAKAARKRNR